MGYLRVVLPILLVLILFSLPLRSQPGRGNGKPPQQVSPLAQAAVDSLQALVQTTAGGTGKIEVYGQLCFTYASTIGNLPLAHQYADSIRLVAEQVKEPSGLAASQYYYGMLARYDGKYAEALQYLTHQMDYCKATGDSSGLANSLLQMAVVYHDLGDYEQSLQLSYRTLAMYERDGFPYGEAMTFMHVGNLFSALKKWGDAIAMYHKSLFRFTSLPEDLNAKMGKLRVLINLGNAYAELKQYEKARRFYKQSLSISHSIGSKRTAATTLGNIGEVLSALGQYDSALVYHLEALAIREQASQKDKMLLSLIWVGETYIFLKYYPQANHYLSRALSLSKASRAKPTVRDAYQKLSALYAAQRDYRKALEYHQLFAQMKDSVLNEENARQLNELQTKYETGEKDKQIAILAKEKQVQQKEAQRQALQQKALAGGLALVTVIGLLLIYLLRQRLKNQKLVMAKNQQIKESEVKRQLSELATKALRAQMNPHFIFNCMNSINRMILDGDNDSASRYLTKLSKLIRMILENSEKATVSLRNELAMLDAYVQLENLRFKGRIQYELTVDEEIDQENTFLPSMVLQPFVENAIWHGLMHKEKNEPGCICIRIAETEDMLTCMIEDNGVGREMATALKEKSVLSSKSMGLQITEERLRLFNKGKTGQLIQITDLKDSLNQALGTRVNIHVPLA